MKHLYSTITILLIYFSKNLSAQPYQAFPTDSAVWSVMSYEGSTAEQHLFDTKHYGISGDTIINNTVYHKIVSSNDIDFNISDSANYYMGAFREENKIVYFINAASPSEDTLYNFNLLEGSFMPPLYDMQTSIADSIIMIDSMLVNGSYHKRYVTLFDVLNTFIGYYSISLVEGMGAVAGIRVFPPVDSSYPNGQKVLLCFKRGEEIFYKNADLDTCHYTTMDYNPPNSINEHFEREKVAHIYPNPSAHTLTVMLDELAEVLISLKSINGKEMISEISINNGITQIDISSVPPGIYFIEIYSQNKMETHKILKI